MPFVIRHSACRLLLRWCTAELDLGQSHKHGGRRHRPSLRVDEQPIDLGKLKPDPGHREHKRVTVVVTFPGRQWSRAKETLEQSRSSGWWRCLHCRPILTNAFSDTPASGKGTCVGLPGVWRGVAAPSISRHSVQCVASRVLHQLTSEKCMFWKIARLVGHQKNN